MNPTRRGQTTRRRDRWVAAGMACLIAIAAVPAVAATNVVTAAANASAERAPTNAPAATLIRAEGAAAGEWTADLDAAKALASKTGLPLLVWFTGSDWCAVCRQLDRTVMSSAEWKAYARGKLVLVAIDSPRNEALVPEKYRQRNAALVRQFEVQGFPTLMFLDATGQPIGQEIRLRQGDMEPFAFLHRIGASLRTLPAERKRVLDALPDDAARVNYLGLLKDLNTAQAGLEAWMAGRPPPSDANEQAFEAQNAKIDALESDVERIEIEVTLRGLSASAEESRQRFDLTLSARRQIAALRELAQAESDMEAWLVARPAPGEASSARLRQLVAHLEQARAGLAAVK